MIISFSAATDVIQTWSLLEQPLVSSIAFDVHSTDLLMDGATNVKTGVKVKQQWKRLLIV
jgi:hypothetical protein